MVIGVIMFRQFSKAFEPITRRLFRGVGITNGEGGSGGAFQHVPMSKEEQLTESLKSKLPGITYVSVEDISGGCGAMFEVSIEAKEFIGLSTIKQHRLVTETLKSDIKEMHGIRIHTAPSKTEDK